jgi:diguanylate cyclase (GGDEF)-like protein
MNAAWRAFGRPNVGQSYLAYWNCRDDEDADRARRVTQGIMAVLEERLRSFSLEYPEKQRWFSLLAAPIAADRFRGAVVLHIDITERVLAEERAGHLANHDPLTGLPNRRLLEDRLQQTIAQARRRSDLLALLYIDLDSFKRVNDRFGHRDGDTVLKEIAGRMRAATREADTLARTGGDEFTLIAVQLQEAGAADLIAAKLISAVVQPLRLHDQEVAIGASIGIAVWPEDGDTPEQLERRADEAMYRAKQAGKNRFCRWLRRT